MKKLSLLVLLLGVMLVSSEVDDMNADIEMMKAEFEQMKASHETEFESYSQSIRQEYEAYERELEQYWKDPKLSTKKDWVSYSKDSQSRANVDFQNNYIEVETVALNIEDAKKQLEERLSYVVTKNTKEVLSTDPLYKKLDKVKKPVNIEDSIIDAKPILSEVIFDKKPTKKDVDTYTKNALKDENIKVTPSKVAHKNVYKIKVSLPENTTLKRSKVYKNEVTSNSNRFDIPLPLIFAVIQTESNFNPFAKSHIPAFGLMQIVPTSAGKDVYKFLYKKNGMPTAAYLYNGSNNIEMGSAYLHILYYRYLKRIKNPQSRLYCTIAAYNTGAGNVAWAFAGRKHIKKASIIINKMTPDEVYSHLLANLKYDEPKDYLKRVKKRINAFNLAYN